MARPIYFHGELDFYWVREGVIAGADLPMSKEAIEEIAGYGIKRVVSVEQPDRVAVLLEGTGIDQLKLAFKDFSTPSAGQVKTFLHYIGEALVNKEPVMVHCAAGCGRTGLLLMLYLMFFESWDLEQGLAELRTYRPCAVESLDQEQFLQRFNPAEYREV